MDEIEELEKRVEEAKSRNKAALKQTKMLLNNIENLLVRWNNGTRNLKSTKNEIVKCAEHGDYHESCLTSISRILPLLNDSLYDSCDSLKPVSRILPHLNDTVQSSSVTMILQKINYDKACEMTFCSARPSE